jgi:hypothetical protein
MTTFNISDITPAGAFTNAVTAAQSSDRRSAGRNIETGKRPKSAGLLTTLARRIAAAIVEIRQTASQSASRPV